MPSVLSGAEAAGLVPVAGYGWRLGIDVAVLSIALVGGRIIRSFTRNCLSRRGAERLPAVFGLLDKTAPAATALTGASWTLLAEAGATALAALAAACCRRFASRAGAALGPSRRAAGQQLGGRPAGLGQLVPAHGNDNAGTARGSS